MQTLKMSLANIKGKLSRAEMKNIMAGSGGCCPDGRVAHCFGTYSNCTGATWGNCNVGQSGCLAYCTVNGASTGWC